MTAIFDKCRETTAECLRTIYEAATRLICLNDASSCHSDITDNIDTEYWLEFASADEINKEFDKFLISLDLRNEKLINELYSFSVDKKRRILRNRKQMTCVKDVDLHINSLKNIEHKDSSDLLISTLDSLYVLLRTSKSSIDKFVACKGVECLRDWLDVYEADDVHSFSIMKIFKTLSKCPIGRTTLANDERVLNSLAVIATNSNLIRSKISAIQILTSLCYVEHGRENVLNSFEIAKSRLGERRRFQRLIWHMSEKLTPVKLDFGVKISTLCFINILLRSGKAETDIAERASLQSEFNELGIEEILDSFLSIDNEQLKEQLNIFCQLKKIYEKKIDKKLSSVDQDIRLADDFDNIIEGDVELFLSKLKDSIFSFSEQQRHVSLKFCETFIESLTVEDVNEMSENLLENLTIKLSSVLHKNVDVVSKSNEEISQKLFNASNNEVVEEHISERSAPISPGISESDSTTTTTKLAVVRPFVPAPPAPPPLPLTITRCELFPKTATLKGFNWIPLTEAQLAGTIWMDFAKEDVSYVLNDELLDKNFSVQSKSKRDSYAEVGRCVSILDPRRAQNCHILLTKLKLSNEDIRHVITTLDQNEEIHKDMIEQMFKFIPTKEETEKLERAEKEIALNNVDTFFLVVSRIPKYEQRLKSIWLTKVFSEKTTEIKRQCDAVIKSSAILQTSKRIRKLLGIVLSIGNRMNEGRRNGRAPAFHISSLSELFSVKSNAKADYTLMHYFVECCDSKVPEVFRLKKEITAMTEASKVSTNNLESEVNVIRNCLDMVKNELDETCADDLFYRPKMTKFVVDAEIAWVSVQATLQRMNESYSTCMKMFAVNTMPSTTPMNTGDFFSIFAYFLNSFLNIRRQLKMEKQENERRIKTLNKVRTINRTAVGCDNFKKEQLTKPHEKRDFEALITALQNGELQLDDLHRLRKSLRRLPPKKTRPDKMSSNCATQSRER